MTQILTFLGEINALLRKFICFIKHESKNKIRCKIFYDDCIIFGNNKKVRSEIISIVFKKKEDLKLDKNNNLKLHGTY